MVTTLHPARGRLARVRSSVFLEGDESLESSPPAELVLTVSPLQRPDFQIKSCSWVLGLRAGTCLSGRGPVESITNGLH